MRRFLISLALIALPLAGPAPVLAQTAEEDRSFLQGLLEDNLSGAGREVRIVGFAGALSARASIEELTIADQDGIWLRLEDVVLDWNRSALLRGRIEVNELTAAGIEVIRPPRAQDELPSPEASSGFTLPELPVSVRIDALSAESVRLGAALFGQATEVSLNGSAALEGGQGEADLRIDRIDGPVGSLILAGAYSNASRILTLNLEVEEEAGGIAATLLDLPGAPAIRLGVTGDAPIDDFTADLHLATDGEERLAGQVIFETLREDGPMLEGSELPPNELITRRFITRIGGDIAPVFAPEYRSFFGPDIRLEVTATRTPDGRMLLEGLDLRADAIRLTGEAAIAADGWPEKLALDGRIAAPDGGPVLLPLSGPRTFVNGVDLDLDYDAATDDRWSLVLALEGMERPDLLLTRAGLEAGGLIARGAGAGSGTETGAIGRVTGQMRFDTDGLSPTDPALAQALEGDIEGRLNFGWTTGEPFRVTGLSLGAADFGLTGEITLTGGEQALHLETGFDLQLAAENLARFASLVGQPLEGAAQLNARGTTLPLTGAFQIGLTGTATDLAIGQPLADPLITGASRLALEASRDETGTRIERFEIVTSGTDLRGSASLVTDASALDLRARLNDAGLILEGIDGPVSLTASARQQGSSWQVGLDAETPGEGLARVTGTLTGNGTDLLLGEGQITAQLGDLSPYSTLAGRALSGAARLTMDVSGDLLARTGRAAGRADSTDLVLSEARIDPLLRGASLLDFDLSYPGDGRIVLDRFDLRNDQIAAEARGRVSLPGGIDRLDRLDRLQNTTLDLNARLSDAGLVIDGLNGPASLTAVARQEGETWRIDLNATTPGDGEARVTGTVTGDGIDSLLAEGQISARLGSLTPYSGLAGRRLAGAARLEATGEGDLLARSGALKGRLEGTNLALSQGNLDALLRGESALSFDLRHLDTGMTILDLVELRTPQGVTDITGRVSPQDSRLRFDAYLRDLGVIAPDISGPASATGLIESSGGDWRIEATGTGPGGTTARTSGTIAPDGQRMNIALSGTAPLSLANARMRPNSVSGLLSYDLTVNGPPAVSSVSGRLQTSGARVVLPGAGFVLADLEASAQIAGGRAQLAAQTTLPSGGQIALSGPVTLTAPFPADLTIDLRDTVLRQRNLYETSARGQVTVTGPLLGGARIGGALSLGTVELRIPESLGPSFADLPTLQHLGDSAAARQTRIRAGMIADPAAQRAGPSASYPIDLTIDAPSRIFVRGRGLDAELGGSLRLTGSTDALVPQGQFELVRGRFNILGKRLDLTEGLVRLQGAFDPWLRFIAETEAEGTAIRIGLEGLASEPELTLTSSPELPQDEVLSLLLFGREITNISALQAVQLATAIRTLSGRGGAGLTDGLRQSIGVDDLDLSTDDSGETQARVGKYISDNIYTDVTVNTAGETEINLNLTVSRSVTVRGRLGSDGGTGIGVYIERDY